MVSRLATCACADVRISVEGEPNIVSMCHCLLCQKRTGSIYSVHAYFSKNKVTIEGLTKGYRRSSDSGRIIEFHFCPNCGSTMFWDLPMNADFIGIPVGVFADPAFPPPDVSIFMPHKHPWVVVPALPVRTATAAAARSRCNLHGGTTCC
jgi:hypothetical protein